MDGLAVKIDETTSYEPDALVNCGPRLSDDALITTNPVIVVDVLSPSTGNLDKTVKVADYLTHPTIEHVLVVDAARRLVHHYRRSAPGKADVTILRDGELVLSPPGLSLSYRPCSKPPCKSGGLRVSPRGLDANPPYRAPTPQRLSCSRAFR